LINNKKTKSLLIKECIGWDCVNWGQSIKYFEQHVDFNKVEKALELGIGYVGGGYSLYLESRDIQVISSDYKGVSDKVQSIHKPYEFSNLFEYKTIDATKIPYKNEFDLVIFKSILGGIARNNNIKLAEQVINEIFLSLKTNGALVFAENITASSLHMYLRNKFWYGKDGKDGKDEKGWKYLSIEELHSMISTKFDNYKYITKGYLGCFGRSESQKRLLGYIDKYLLDNIISEDSKYILFGVCKKNGHTIP
jgi:hypothetical protein